MQHPNLPIPGRLARKVRANKRQHHAAATRLRREEAKAMERLRRIDERRQKKGVQKVDAALAGCSDR